MKKKKEKKKLDYLEQIIKEDEMREKWQLPIERKRQLNDISARALKESDVEDYYSAEDIDDYFQIERQAGNYYGSYEIEDDIIDRLDNEKNN